MTTGVFTPSTSVENRSGNKQRFLEIDKQPSIPSRATEIADSGNQEDRNSVDQKAYLSPQFDERNNNNTCISSADSVSSVGRRICLIRARCHCARGIGPKQQPPPCDGRGTCQ